MPDTSALRPAHDEGGAQHATERITSTINQVSGTVEGVVVQAQHVGCITSTTVVAGPGGEVGCAPPAAPVSGRAGGRLDALTDELAAAVRAQWSAAAAQRGLCEPEPLPMLWRRCEEPVCGPLTAATTARASGSSVQPLPGCEQVTAAELREGTHRGLHRVYGGLASGRLILTGGPGTGKSSAAIMLLLDALRHRDRTPPQQRHLVPVPVLFTLHGWDPRTTPVHRWLVGKLTEFAPLAGPRGRRRAGELLAAGRIAVFLDGLDEIPAALRPVALRALSQQAAFRLVLLTRTTELAAAAAVHVLTSAVALQLQPLAPGDAAAYLARELTDPPSPPWQQLLTALHANASSPVSQALTSPLSVTLLREVYRPAIAGGAAVATVDELLDTARFPDPGLITRHLLDHVITTAYTPVPGLPPPPYGHDAARRTLAVLARHLREHGTRDLAWWEVPVWVPRRARALISALMGTVAVGAAVGPICGLVTGDGIRNVLRHGLEYGAVFALVFGLPFGLAVGLRGTVRPKTMQRFRWRQVRWSSAVRRGLAVGLTTGCTLALGAGLTFGFATGVTSGLTCAIAVTAATGLATCVTSGLTSHSPCETVEPARHRRGDLAYGLTGGLAVALTGGFASGLPMGITAGPVGVLAIGTSLFTVTVMFTGTWMVTASQVYLCIRHRTPLRLGRFLRDAHRRHLLRTVGPVYQFRHATLQDRLAPPPDTGRPIQRLR